MMSKGERLQALIREIGAVVGNNLPLSHFPAAPPETAPDGSDQEEARRLLISQRLSDPSYKSPLEQKRRVFRTKKNTEFRANPDTWEFSGHEIGKAVDALFASDPLERVGVIQSLIQLGHPATVEDLWVYAQNPKFEKDRRKNKVTASQTTSPWLQRAAIENSLDLIIFLCANGSSQASRDASLGIALHNRYYKAAWELLRWRASLGSHQNYFLEGVRNANLEVVRLWLLAPTVSDDQVYEGMCHAVTTPENVENQDKMLSLFLGNVAFFPERAYDLLVRAIQAQNQKTLASILLAATDRGYDLFSGRSGHEAGDAISQIPDPIVRRRVLDLTLSAGMPGDSAALRNELLHSVQDGDIDFTKVLILHGIVQDTQDASALNWAVQKINIDAVEAFLVANVSREAASAAVDRIPAEVEQSDKIRIIDVLTQKGASGDPLARCLVRALEREQTDLVKKLLLCGAPIDFDDSAAVRLVLKTADLALLERMLELDCSPTALCKALPDAMAISSKAERLRAMFLLLTKGVTGEHLHKALVAAVSDGSEKRDVNLIKLLLQHDASVDYSTEGANCIHIAAARGDLEVLRYLCGFSASTDITGEAIPLAFGCLNEQNHSEVLEMLSVLLDTGPKGDPVGRTLIQAIVDSRVQIVELLLRFGIDQAFYGEAIEEALKLDSPEVLRLICNISQIPQYALERSVPIALYSGRYDHEKARLLLDSSRGRESILNQSLDIQDLREHSYRNEIIKMLLDCGADVNFNSGAVVRFAIQARDVDLTKLLLSSGPNKSTLTVAFEVSMELPLRPLRLQMMRMLLEAAKSEIGQDKALVQETREAPTTDLTIVELLLRHNASINFDSGAAISEAVMSQNMPLLELLLKKEAEEKSLTKPFETAMKMKCSEDCRFVIFKALLEAGYCSGGTSVALVESLNRDAHAMEIPQLLLQHSASVDTEKGAALVSAVAAGSLKMLDLFMSYNPSPSSIKSAFREARKPGLGDGVRLSIFQRLLKAGVKFDQVSKALIESTERNPTCLDIPILLLEHGALVDFQDALALQTAITAGALPLVKLLSSQPMRQESVEIAFYAARNANVLSQERFIVYQCLIEKGVSQQERDLALIEEVDGDCNFSTLRLLIGHGASVNVSGGEFLEKVVASGDVSLVETLLKGTERLAYATANLAFEKAVGLPRKQRLQISKLLLQENVDIDVLSRHTLEIVQDGDHELLSLILQKEDSVWANADATECLLHAVREGDIVSIKMLLQQKNSTETLTTAFQELLNHGTISAKTNGLAIAELVLSQGIPQKLVDTALLRVFQASPPQIEQDLVALLLHHGANINISRSECFAIAVRKGDFSMFKLLAAQGADIDSLVRRLITEKMKEEQLLQWLEIAFDQSSSQPQLKDHSILILAISEYHTGSALIKFLVHHGCHAGFEFSYPGSPLLETITILIWALDEAHNVRICDRIILELLERGSEANVNFTTKRLRASAIIQTVKFGRTSVLERLIALGADVSVRDSSGWTALCYASAGGNMELVSMLVQAGAGRNDSSLHLAAKMAYPNIASILLQSGHDPRYPSPAHSGRIPLACLCLEGYSTGEDWERRMQKTMELLIPLTDLNWKVNGKSILHLVLDNNSNNACEILDVFLRTSELWKDPNINDEYLFLDDKDLYYSPTTYVELLCDPKDRDEKDSLIKLLKSSGFKDRYYAEIGYQPEGALGFPPEIELEIKAQLKAEWEKEENIRRQNEIAAHEQRLRQEAHKEATRMQLERDAYERQLAEERYKDELETWRKGEEKLLNLREERAELAIEQELEKQSELTKVRAQRHKQAILREITREQERTRLQAERHKKEIRRLKAQVSRDSMG